jgi:adenine/guanine phosphoribosyltransferase-like PRPP-binding protein
MTHGAPAPYYIVNSKNLPEYLPYDATKKFQFGSTAIELPALKINDDTVIYVLNIMGGNPSYIVNYATDLSYGFESKFGMDVDGFITAEGKSIPLVYEIAFSYDLPYTVLRKSCKPYMGEKVLSSQVKSTTTPEEQKLYLDDKDLINVANKHLIFVDDVITTGATLRACREIVDTVGGCVVGCMAMALEGNYKPTIPTYYLCNLPVIKIEKK